MNTAIISEEKALANISTSLINNEKYIELTSNIDTALLQSQEVNVISVNDINTASHFVKNFKSITKKAEEIRKELVKPLNDEVSDINEFFKSIPKKYDAELNRLETEIFNLKKKLDAEAKEKAEAERKQAEEEQRLKEERLLQEAIEEEQFRKKDLDEGLVDEFVPVDLEQPEPEEIVIEVAKPLKISDFNSFKVTSRRTKVFKVVNIDLVPREYLMIDEAKVKAERMKHDFEALSTIEGVEFGFSEKII